MKKICIILVVFLMASGFIFAKGQNEDSGPIEAKNVILFIGDGMSIGTITAARIYKGQKLGQNGEESKLAMESLPDVALSKTYSTDMQTPESAGTASAMVTGIKTNSGVISVSNKVLRGDCAASNGNETKTIFEMGGERGKALGIVTTARVTHATPATAYAHSANRKWENDSKIPAAAKQQGCVDIAEQFVSNYGNGFQVVFGGGRREFMPEHENDPETEGKKGRRQDGRNLIAEWTKLYPNGTYVYDRKGFDAIDKSTPVLGLFENSHMQYELDRLKDNNEPSLADMTGKAIEILNQHREGYIMMVEGGRIDHAHHATNAIRALEDTLAFDEAIKVALEKTNPNDTLIIVTADHGHAFIMNGYAERGNPILGLSRKNGEYNRDLDGKYYTTLSYGNGPSAVKGERSNPSEQEVFDEDYRQQALIPRDGETHSGEDVVIFALGPQARMFRGIVEQNYIFDVMSKALGFQR